MNGLSMGSQPTLAPTTPSVELSQQPGLNLSKVIVPISHILENLQNAANEPAWYGLRRSVSFEDLQAAAHSHGYGVNEADAKKHNLLNGAKPTTLGKFLEVSKEASDVVSLVKDVAGFISQPFESLKKGIANHILPMIEESKMQQSLEDWRSKNQDIARINDKLTNEQETLFKRSTSVGQWTKQAEANSKQLKDAYIPNIVFDVKNLTPTIIFDGNKEIYSLGGDISKGHGVQATLENGVLTMALGDRMAGTLPRVSTQKDGRFNRDASLHQQLVAEPQSQMMLRVLDHFEGRVRVIRSTFIASEHGRSLSTADVLANADKMAKSIALSTGGSAYSEPERAKVASQYLQEKTMEANVSHIYGLRGWGVKLDSLKIEGQVVSFSHVKNK
jgi:hypothetical protein